MLACLPVSNPTFQLRSHLQMNTGLQKWDTTQKMRSAHYPSPAELDAFAKKIASNPLTIKIFPNSVKVPQRKHIRRTVNGLDTSSHRYSPYPSQESSRSGLLAIVKVPVKVLKGLDASCTRFLPKPIMNPHSGPYAAQSTLPPQQTVAHLLAHPQPPAGAHKQGLPTHHLQQQQQQPPLQQQGMARPQTIQHHGLPHPPSLRPQTGLSRQQTLQQTLQQQQHQLQQQTLQQQQQRPGLNHPQSLLQQQRPGLSQPQSLLQQQRPGLSQPQSLLQQQRPGLSQPQSLLQQQQQKQQQMASQGLRLLAEMAPMLPPHGIQSQAQAQTQAQAQALSQAQNHAQAQALSQTHAHAQAQAQAQGLSQPQTLPPQATTTAGAGSPAPSGMVLVPGMHSSTPRKLPDGDAPPNVTVSTSTIPLSMAASLHHNRPSDLSSIVHQINQFCQARAGAAGTSVCEGQIANPSPINRNLLINASSRACGPYPHQHTHPHPHPHMHPHPHQHPPQHHHPRPMLQPVPSSCALNPNVTHASAIQPATMAVMSRLPHYQNHLKQPPQPHLPQQPQAHWKQQQQQPSLPLSHMSHMPDGPPPCKSVAREDPGGSGFPTKGLPYSQQEACMGQQPYGLKAPLDKPTPSPPVSGMVGGPGMNYNNGHYVQQQQQPPWGSILPTPNSDSSGSQDLAINFHGGLPGGSTSVDCSQGTHYRTGAVGVANSHPGLVPNVDYMAADFPSFREQSNMGMMGKMPRLPVMTNARAPDSGDNRNVPIHHHPGYR